MKSIDKRATEKKWRDLAKKKRSEIKQISIARAREAGIRSLFIVIGGADGKPTPEKVLTINAHIRSALPTNVTCAPLSVKDFVYPLPESSYRKIRIYRSTCSPKVSERRQLLELLLDVARCEGPISAEEDQVLQEIVTLLEFSVIQYEKLRHKRIKKKSIIVSREKHADLYEILSCSPSDCDETIKRSYRRLAKHLHPDSYTSQKLSPERIAQRVKEFQQLQAAYEQIKKDRKGF